MTSPKILLASALLLCGHIPSHASVMTGSGAEINDGGSAGEVTPSFSVVIPPDGLDGITDPPFPPFESVPPLSFGDEPVPGFGDYPDGSGSTVITQPEDPLHVWIEAPALPDLSDFPDAKTCVTPDGPALFTITAPYPYSRDCGPDEKSVR